MNDAEKLSIQLLHVAFQKKASDIHFYPYHDKTKVYFRIYGKRVYNRSLTLHQYNLLLTYYKFTSGMDIGEIRKPQNGTIFQQYKKITYALRLSTLPAQQNESLAIRILPQDENLPINNLFLFPNQLKIIKHWIKHQAGIILFTGPTGSGKTTTLYALLEAVIKENSYQTITLEDPIEKRMSDILQVQVNEKAGITYQTGLKAALRHDPDVIMVGEIRDEQTAKFAFGASLTGHLVLSTLHAKNTEGTIHRLLDMGIPRTEIEQSIIGIASLELLPIEVESRVIGRAAIMEILDRSHIQHVLSGQSSINQQIQTFDHLRKKAFAYGYISEETFLNLS